MTHKNTKKLVLVSTFNPSYFKLLVIRAVSGTPIKSPHTHKQLIKNYYKPFEMLKNQIKKTSGQISQNMLMFSSIYAHVFIYSYRCFWNLTIQVFRYSSGSVSPFGGSVDALPSRTAI